jgi:translocation and assembly module TamA
MIKKLFIIMIIACYSTIAVGAILKQSFEGVSGELHNIIIERTKITQQDVPVNLTAEWVHSYQEQAIIEIKNLLAAYGYFNAKITGSISHSGATWTLTYSISPGHQLRVTHLDLQVTGEGASDNAFKKLLANFPIRQGDFVRSKFYQEAKSKLLDLAVQRGYFSAKIEKSNIIINLEKDQATVIIYFNTGPRYYFGKVTYLPSPYSTQFLQRFVPFKEGQPFHNKKILFLQENLGNSNLFQQVTVTPKPGVTNDLYVPVEVAVLPRNAYQYNLGAGFGTDTGFRGMASTQIRRINSRGHHLEAEVQASQKTDHLETSYSIPGRNPVTDLYKLSVAAEDQRLSNGKSRNEKIEGSYIRRLYGWQQNLSLSLRDEHSEPTDGRPIINSTMLLPNLNWVKTKADDPLDPNWGYQVDLNFRGASRAIISNTDFIQGLLQTKALVPISSKTRLVWKGQLGYTLIKDINQLPITLQFYTGGSQTVRGYQFQEIGPGTTLVLGSVELQQCIKGKLYATIFFDVGSVSNSLMGNLKKGVGFGVLWRSPIGALEATLAQALDNPGHPILLQFSMGSIL